MFTNKTLLITGGTGSFGNAVLKRFLNSDLKEIRIFSRDEKKQHDMRLLHRSDKIKYIIGDVRDSNSIDEATCNVDFIFSAAALKQVPSCEFYPIEAVKTNILGTANVLNAAVKNNVQNVIVLSTDKAVCSINAMGATKFLMEKVAIAKSRFLQDQTPTICVTRYGNVMATRGSVIPLFVEQIKLGKDVTVTDPTMTRFMMSLEEAVALVLFAFKEGISGDTFVQKSPAVTIDQLSRVLIKIFNSSSKIRIIGTRHGEKNHELLLNVQERSRAIDLGKYFRLPSDTRGLNYDKYFIHGNQSEKYEEYGSKNTRRLSDQELEETLLRLDYIQEKLK